MRRLIRRTAALLALLLLSAAGAVWHFRYVPPQADRAGTYRPPEPAPDDLSWSSYGGDPGHARHSALRQITAANVAHLQPAWTYRTGEIARRGAAARHGKFQNTPILAAGHLVLCTPFNRVVALDPATGAERWVFDAGVATDQGTPDEKYNCRGLAQWSDPDAAAAAGQPADCGLRLFMGTTDRRVIALDARTGRPCAGFGTDGQLRVPLDRPGLREAELQFASAPAVVGDVVVLGSASGDNGRAHGPAGTVRAFDARSGVPRWTFDPIPRAFDPVASPSWAGDSAAATGQANVWGPISVDPARDLVFLPTSSPSPDFYGGLRAGDNRYANSVVALRGATGAVAWHFQTVHHDLWDYDVPAGPTLVDFRKDGRVRPALVFATKTGFLFVLDRETGEPLTAVEERPVPASDVPGEAASPTQPFSIGQPVLAPQRVTEDDAFGLMIWDRLACRDRIRAAARNEGVFTPPSLGGGTLIVPMDGGGANWGGVAVDPSRNRVFVNTNRAIHHVTLLPPEEAARRKPLEPKTEISLMRGAPYGMIRRLVTSPLGLPCNKPPWNVLAAVDIETGRLAWEATLGNTKELAPLGLAFRFGTPGFGGPIATAGGVVFIGATMDRLLRAFDAQTGAELWAGALPHGGHATPMTYAIGGRQYVVIAAGGHPNAGDPVGESVVAFALPR